MPSPTSLTRRITVNILIIYSFLVFWVPCTTLATEIKKAGSGNAHPDTEWSVPIRFYQKTISLADGNRCPMHPSCSHYALDSFKQHNFFVAWMLTCDRLLRCGRNEIDLAPRVRVRGELKAFDPLSANTFWWEKP